MKLIEEKTEEAVLKDQLLVHLFPIKNLVGDLDVYLDELHEQYPGNRRLNVILVNKQGWRVYTLLHNDEPWLALYRLGDRPCDPKYFDAMRYCPQCNKIHPRVGQSDVQGAGTTSAKRRTLADWKQWWRENNPYIKDFKPQEPRYITPTFPSLPVETDDEEDDDE